MDVDDIKPGADFVSLIGEKVASCDAVIAVIGKNWLARDEDNGKSRLDDPADFVRLELEHALQRDILLIPALVEGAEMPGVEDLPVPLSELSQRQAVELSDKDFQRGVDKIIAVLEKFPAMRHLRTKKRPARKSYSIINSKAAAFLGCAGRYSNRHVIFGLAMELRQKERDGSFAGGNFRRRLGSQRYLRLGRFL